MKRVFIVLLVALICVPVFASQPRFGVTAVFKYSVNQEKSFVPDSVEVVGDFKAYDILSSSANVHAELGYHYALKNEPEVSNGIFSNVEFSGELNDYTTLSSGLSANFSKMKTSSFVGAWSSVKYNKKYHDFNAKLEYKYSFANDPEISGFYFDWSFDKSQNANDDLDMNYDIAGSVELHRFDRTISFTDCVMKASTSAVYIGVNGFTFTGATAFQYCFDGDPYESGLFTKGAIICSFSPFDGQLWAFASFHAVEKEIKIGAFDVMGEANYAIKKTITANGFAHYAYSVDNTPEENGLSILAFLKEKNTKGEAFVQFLEADFHNINSSLKMNMGVGANYSKTKLPNKNFAFTFGFQYNFIRNAGADIIDTTIGSFVINNTDAEKESTEYENYSDFLGIVSKNYSIFVMSPFSFKNHMKGKAIDLFNYFDILKSQNKNK